LVEKKSYGEEIVSEKCDLEMLVISGRHVESRGCISKEVLFFQNRYMILYLFY
jgi:hypothetical protein